MPKQDQLTLAELFVEIHDNLGHGISPADADKTKYVKYLNHIQKVLSRRHGWRSLERNDSTFILDEDVYSYTLPTAICTLIDAALIDDTVTHLASCDADWTSGTAAATHDSSFKRFGAASLKLAMSAANPSGVMAYSTITSTDLSGYTDAMLGFWIYSTIAVAAGALSIVVSEAAAGAKTGVLGTNYVTCTTTRAVTPYRWQYFKVVDKAFTNLNATISLSVFAESNYSTSAVHTIYIDGVGLYARTYGGQHWPLAILDDESFTRLCPNPLYYSTSRPTAIAQVGGIDGEQTLEFFRIPDASYPVWLKYYAWPSPFTASLTTAVSDIEDIDDVLIAGATWVAFCKERAWESAGQWEGIFRRLLSEAASCDRKRDGWHPVRQPHPMGSSQFGVDLEVPANTQTGDRSTTSGFFYT